MVFFAFLELHGVGKFDFWLVASVLGTRIHDGFVIIDFLMVLVGCLVIVVWISCRVLGHDGLVMNIFHSFAVVLLDWYYKSGTRKKYLIHNLCLNH